MAATISMTPPSLPNGLDNAFGNSMPKGLTNPRKLAENQRPQKATA